MPKAYSTRDSELDQEIRKWIEKMGPTDNLDLIQERRSRESARSSARRRREDDALAVICTSTCAAAAQRCKQ